MKNKSGSRKRNKKLTEEQLKARSEARCCDMLLLVAGLTFALLILFAGLKGH